MSCIHDNITPHSKRPTIVHAEPQGGHRRGAVRCVRSRWGLAGLIRCRRCGRRLTVRYSGGKHRVARYSCDRGALGTPVHRVWWRWGRPGHRGCLARGGRPRRGECGRRRRTGATEVRDALQRGPAQHGGDVGAGGPGRGVFGVREAEEIGGAEADVPALGVDDDALRPRLGAGVLDAEHEAETEDQMLLICLINNLFGYFATRVYPVGIGVGVKLMKSVPCKVSGFPLARCRAFRPQPIIRSKNFPIPDSASCASGNEARCCSTVGRCTRRGAFRLISRRLRICSLAMGYSFFLSGRWGDSGFSSRGTTLATRPWR